MYIFLTNGLTNIKCKNVKTKMREAIHVHEIGIIGYLCKIKKTY